MIKDLKVMIRNSVEVCRRRALKLNTDKNKVIVLGWKAGLIGEVRVDGIG